MLAVGSRPEGYRWGTGRAGYSPQGILSPMGRQAYNEIAEGRVVGELEGCAGEMLVEHRGGGSPLSAVRLEGLGESGRGEGAASPQSCGAREAPSHACHLILMTSQSGWC